MSLKRSEPQAERLVTIHADGGRSLEVRVMTSRIELFLVEATGSKRFLASFPWQMFWRGMASLFRVK